MRRAARPLVWGMKQHTKFAPAWLASGLALFLGACSNGLSPDSYRLRFPALPAVWEEALGPPEWQVSWVDEAGNIRQREAAAGFDVTLAEDWPAAVIARPCWPEHGIRASLVKPAGAVYPFDARDGNLPLSWEGGVDAFFYFELAKGGNENRAPYLFDWKRFRALFTSGALPADVVQDPWLADWEDIARKTCAAGFDARRIKAAKVTSVTFTPPEDGPWLGLSVFAQPLYWESHTPVIVPGQGEVSTWFSARGILRVSGEVVLFKPYSAEKSQ